MSDVNKIAACFGWGFLCALSFRGLSRALKS